MSARLELRGEIAVITLDHPPVNELGWAMRQALLAAAEQCSTDPTVRAIVLTGGERVFSGGADVREFGSP